MTFYWVNFDVPQIDADGDGPYCGAEIDAEYLRLGPATTVSTPPVPEGTVEATWYENERLGKKVEFKAFTAAGATLRRKHPDSSSRP